MVIEGEITECPVTDEDRRLIADATLLDPSVFVQPRKFYAAMRKLDPVHYGPSLQMYLVSRWEDIQTVQRDPITFSVNKGYHEQQAKGFADEFRAILEEKGGGHFPDAIMSDPPYHTRIRKLMEQAFTAHRVKELEPRIAKIVEDLLDEIKADADGHGRMDAITGPVEPATQTAWRSRGRGRGGVVPGKRPGTPDDGRGSAGRGRGDDR